MDLKRQRGSDLLRAHLLIKEIVSIIRCSKSLFYQIRKIKSDDESLERRSGRGGHNRTLQMSSWLGSCQRLSPIPHFPWARQQRTSKWQQMSILMSCRALWSLGLIPTMQMVTICGNKMELQATRPKRLQPGARKNDLWPPSSPDCAP